MSFTSKRISMTMFMPMRILRITQQCRTVFFPKRNWNVGSARQMKIPVEVSPRPPFDELETWKRAKLDANLLDALLQKGFIRPSASQRWAVPLLLTGKDVMLCSQTGVERKLFFFAHGVSLVFLISF